MSFQELRRYPAIPGLAALSVFSRLRDISSSGEAIRRFPSFGPPEGEGKANEWLRFFEFNF
jgi:hypothetical protein